jgi:FKBP-type peptidyl-prolyl cis-trans isomerase
MKLRLNSRLMAGLVVFSVAGCQEPKEITPVAPPGFEMPRVVSGPQSEPAQAIGEQRASQATSKPKVSSTTAGSPPSEIGKAIANPSGLTYETLKEGTGETAKAGQTVTMHYTGTLTDGTVFDSSRTKNQPFTTKIGVGQVIGGWDEGVPGMKVGERRKLTIPPDLGYGPVGSPPKIPGNATLIFDVELLGVQ